MKKTNINKGDFLISDLPRNRYALFFDILKNQWRSLLLMAVIILLLFLPIILLRFFNLVMINSVVNNGEGTNLKAEVFNTFVGYSIINFIVVVVVGILFGGVARIYKKLAFNEGFFLGADFIRGIKENFKDYFWLFLIYGLLNMLLEILCMNYMLDNNYLYYFFKVLNYATLLPILGVSMSVCALYSDPFIVKVKSSIRIYIKNLFKILLAVIIVLLPLVLLLINSSIFQLLVPIIYSFIYFPLGYLILVLILNSIFDKDINEKNFPDLVGKGMYKPY